MKQAFLFIFCILSTAAFSQSSSGIITGNVLDERQKPLEGASVSLINSLDTSQIKTTTTEKDGSFDFQSIAYGRYKLRISFVGLQPLVLDSIHFRQERSDFNLSDLVLKNKATDNLDEVVVYAEKPLIQSKEGNITFNASESALSAGSTAGELLTNVPLVTKDPTGKLLVRGKEPKILIDDKPVELNQQQLQDLLESLPGSSIEKIEVMTNPPPQYAGEQGGVINITTKKGKVGKSGRINVSYGTRGEASISGNFNYRRQGLSFNVSAGGGYNEFRSENYSFRTNANNSKVRNESKANNKNFRPNLRANLDYDLNKFNGLNFVLNYNQNRYDNSSLAGFSTINIFDSITALRDRIISNDGENFNPNTSVTFTHKTKKPGEVFRVIANANFSESDAIRDFYEQYLNPDFTATGKDSTQFLRTTNSTKVYNFRTSYDLPLKDKKTFLSTGAFHNVSSSDIVSDAQYVNAVDGKWTALEALNNSFTFNQKITNLRGSVKKILGDMFSVTAGLAAEHTDIHFDLFKTNTQSGNNYWSYLPLANINKNWRDKHNLTFSYRRTIRRPGVGELNPTVDSADQYNLRVGNLRLKPSLTHNFDLVFGKTKNSYFANISLGYNQVSDVFNLITTAIDDKTNLRTWENSSGKNEYEISTWSGYTVNKNTKVNVSASYTYNAYSRFDKEVRNFRDGGSLTSSINTSYTWKDIYNVTGSFTYNRFANPQGNVRSNLSMNVGFQAKALDKKLILTVNFIDPFLQQENRSFTYGKSFIQENFSATATRNLRFTAGYNFSKSAAKKGSKIQIDKQKMQKLLRNNPN